MDSDVSNETPPSNECSMEDVFSESGGVAAVGWKDWITHISLVLFEISQVSSECISLASGHLIGHVDSLISLWCCSRVGLAHQWYLHIFSF